MLSKISDLLWYKSFQVSHNHQKIVFLFLNLDFGDVSFFNKKNCFLLIIYAIFARYKELFAYFCGVKKKKNFIRKI
jgi:hypothetical protein